MKSLFKRVLASATGTVLVLSQLAAVNINAADNASDLVINRAWLTEVPNNELDNVTVEALPVVLEGEEASGTSILAGTSDWNNRLESAVLAVTGDAASVTKTTLANAVKDAIKKRLYTTRYFSEEQAQRAVDLLTDIDVTINADGTATATLEFSEASALFGEIAEQNWEEDGFNAAGDIDIDWSGFSLTGTATIDVDFSAYDKTATYNVTINDGTTTYDGIDAFVSFANAKFGEAIEYVLKQAKEQGSASTRLEAQAAQYAKRLTDAETAAAKLAKAIGAIQLTAADPDEAYNAYLDAVDAAIDNAGVSERVVNRAKTELAKAPANFTASVTEGKTGLWIDKVLDLAKQFSDEQVTIDLAAADVADIINEGYDYDIQIDGYSGSITFSLADDEEGAAEAKAIIEKKFADTWAAEGLELVSIETHKEASAEIKTDNLVDGELLTYDIVRYVDLVVLKEIEETTTEQTTTTTSEEPVETTTTTESEEPVETTTTTESEEPVETTTTTESEIPAETTTTTESEIPAETTTTTDTEEPTQTTTTAEGVIIGNYEYQLDFVGDAGVKELVYWSEETTAFDLTNLSVSMQLTKINVNDKADITSKNIDVTADFAALQQSPQDFDFQGFGHYALQIALADADALKATLGEEVDADVVDALANRYKIANGETMAQFDGVSYIDVILVLRGDANLDNKVDTKDANTVQNLYNYIDIVEGTLDEILASPLILFQGGNEFNFLKYGHYAGDADDGIGKLDTKDANDIQKYYNAVDIVEGLEAGPEAWTDAFVVGKEVTPLAELHADTLKNSGLQLN